MELTLKDAVDFSEGRLISKGEDLPVKRFSLDSRTAGPGDVFIAVKGTNFDGHDFIEEALLKGVSAVIAERFPVRDPDTGVKNLIMVKDSIKAMAKVASCLRKVFDTRVICVTGTNGKTTVKDLTAFLLSARYKVLKSRASYNNVFGVCLTIFEMDGSHEAAVLELGTNSPGEIAFLSEVASPDIAVITNVGRGHLERLEGKDGVFREKASILSGLRPGGIAIVNGDDEMLSKLTTAKNGIFYYGTGKGCKLTISGIEDVLSGVKFFADGEEFFLPFFGRHNVYNAAAAISVAKIMGIPVTDIKDRIKNSQLPGMRLEKSEISGIIFLNDAYNANPDSFNAALDALSSTRPRGERWVVAGDMKELGKGAREMHRSLGARVASLGLDFLITIGELADDILEAAIASGMDEKRTFSARSHCEAASKINETAPPGTIVLVKGSRLMKMEEVIKCFTTCCTR